MPELPEVETIRLQLSQKIVGKRLNGQKIVGVRRRAKLLIIDFDDGTSLVFHLKLTGQLIFNGKPSQYTREVFNFDDGSQLIFNDVRKFGWWKKVKETKKIEREFGPEALEISLKTFKTLLAGRPKAKIKPLLMDQKFIAGIGNIYSDEILFAAKVAPLRLPKTLTDKEIRGIFQNIKKILKAAIRHQGSSVTEALAEVKKRTKFSSPEYYLDACGRPGNYAKYHKVYHREKCSLCGAKIKKIKIGGRSSHFCPNCQK